MDSTAPLPSQALKIVRIQEETEQAKSFVLKPVGGVLEYKPGQFLTLLFTSITGEPVRRSYSLSSTPVLGEPLTMTVKRVTNGEFSRKLVDHFKEGDVLKTIGASGFFILPEFVHSNDRFVFVAAGSGITPVFSLIKTLIHLHPENKILLVYANSDRRSTIFYHALLELSERSANFEIVWLFSRTPDLDRSRLTPDLLEQLLREHDIEPGLPIFYICGPPAFMRMATFKLSSLNFPASRIKKEIFVAEKIVETPKPPDLQKHEVVLLKDDKR